MISVTCDIHGPMTHRFERDCWECPAGEDCPTWPFISAEQVHAFGNVIPGVTVKIAS